MLIGSLTSSLLVSAFLHSGIAIAKKNYIVTLSTDVSGESSNGLKRRQEVHAQAEIAASAIIYDYKHSVNGYAASLTDAEMRRLNAQPEVVSVREEKVYQLQTTRTPRFLGLLGNDELLGARDFEYSGMPSNSKRGVDPAEANIIIGLLDSGAWPENPSYDDTGMPEIPSHWKGSCDVGEQWTVRNCNKKLIGAAYFYEGYKAALESDLPTPYNFTANGEILSARDSDGHGTHTSTTAAGSIVSNASLFGQAAGTARGMAKDARIATYKVCWRNGCAESDLLAALDRAISDGVNIISASIGSRDPSPEFGGEALNTGSFAAMEKGIFTSLSAGNSGPDFASVTNVAPWEFTVAASTLDRIFPASVTLGDGRKFPGVSLYVNGAVPDVKPLSSDTVLPLFPSSQASLNSTDDSDATQCLANSLNSTLIAGKIVVCTRGKNGRAEKVAVVKALGGRGVVLVNTEKEGDETIADGHVLPAVHIGYKAGALVLKYAALPHATASLNFEGTKEGVPAPLMASFSSRGPNGAIPQIMKPDITGPGVDILAGWTRLEGIASDAQDTRRVDYNVISGTSMSCPHLSGLAGYIMARRPEWSISAIRSALMTTAYRNTKGTANPIIDSATSAPATPFDYGAGHVDPVAALNPGLVYETTSQEYKEFLCSLNSTEAFMIEVTRSKFKCLSDKKYSPYDLNYPSFGAFYLTSASKGTYTAKFRRTLTSVGGAGTYTASYSVKDPRIAEVVSVKPSTLTFGAAGEKKSFELVVKMKPTTDDLTNTTKTSHGRLEWKDGKHTVSSPIGFIWG